MKIIIDPYRGGQDTGININGKYEKNILLEISKYMVNRFIQNGIDAELLRTTDISLTDDERNSIVNEIKNNNDLIIQNRFTEDGEFNIIYPLRSSDVLPTLINNSLEANQINLNKFFQRRLPTNTLLDYYNIIRNTKPNETIIIEYLPSENYQKIVNIIVDTISSYINKKNTYTVKKGDSLYQIANKYGVTVEEIKKLNNLSNNLLSIGQTLKIPQKSSVSEDTINITYIVKKGDSLYQIANKYGVSVEEIKKLNNLSNNLLSIGQTIKIPQKGSVSEDTINITYTVKKGDSLYQISKKYGVTVEEIKILNNLSSNLLSIGQILKIPK